MAVALSVLSRRVAAALSRFPQIELAYLYGSALERPDFEDIDVAVGLKKSAKISDTIVFRVRVSSALARVARIPKEFDVHLLNEMPPALQHRVISTGRCILCREDLARIRFETRVLNEFLDFRPAHDWFVRKTLERVSRP